MGCRSEPDVRDERSENHLCGGAVQRIAPQYGAQPSSGLGGLRRRGRESLSLGGRALDRPREAGAAAWWSESARSRAAVHEQRRARPPNERPPCLAESRPGASSPAGPSPRSSRSRPPRRARPDRDRRAEGRHRPRSPAAPRSRRRPGGGSRLAGLGWRPPWCRAGGAPIPRLDASQAPSSSAAQSCSPPANGTQTPSPDSQSTSAPLSRPTSAGARSTIDATSSGKASASRSAASRRRSRTSYAEARRTASSTGSTVVNAAVRASTPSEARRSVERGRRRGERRSRPAAVARSATPARGASQAARPPRGAPRAARRSKEGRARVWSGRRLVVTAPPTSRAGSWFRIARSSSCSSRPGSIPKPSLEPSPRAAVDLERIAPGGPTGRGRASAAAANGSWSGCCAASSSSSPTSSRCRPRASSASRRCSSAASRISSSRPIAICANGSRSRSASAGPRQRASASRCSSNARSASPRASAWPASSVSRSNRLRSSCSAADVEDVAGRPGLEPRLLAERLAKLGDLAVHLRRRRDGRAPRVELVGEPVDRDDPVRVQEQDRERRPLLRPAELHRPVGPDDLERAEDPELEHRRTVAVR